MKAADVPRVLRGSLLETEAYTDGRKAALAGLARERNPWVQAGSLHPPARRILGKIVSHAIRDGRSPDHSFCGLWELNEQVGVWSDQMRGFRCERCIAGVNALRNALEREWNRGYRDGMKERG